MHDVHTLSRFGAPLTVACTVWMFGFQRRRVRRCEWEMLLPKPGPLPQTSQVAAMVDTLSSARDSIGWWRGARERRPSAMTNSASRATGGLRPARCGYSTGLDGRQPRIHCPRAATDSGGGDQACTTAPTNGGAAGPLR